MKIYKITEASEYLGVSINTLKTLANNGKIKSFKTAGEHRRFRQDDLDAYMGVEKEKQEKLTVIYARCSTANTVRPEEELCICARWARFGHALFTEHHRNCSKYAPEKDARKVIESLLQAMIDWGNDSDGIPDRAFEPFKRACFFVGHTEWVKND